LGLPLPLLVRFSEYPASNLFILFDSSRVGQG
jgi:hypothetical protein